MKITFNLNGKSVEREIAPAETLLEMLRACNCSSVRQGCDTANCGICTVWVDGVPVLSCSYPAARAEGRQVTTVEGVRPEAEELMTLLAEEGSDQCGYCSPGFIMAALAMLKELENPTEEEIPHVPVALKGNVLTRSMNCITEQYSLPAYDGVDPNPVMAPFFIFFFGMMMADMAYGLLMILGSLLFLKKKRPDDRSFMEMIFWCGITTFIFGALTGGFLGDFIPQLCRMINPESTFALPSLFDPLNDTMAIMVGSLVLGVIQIFTGMAVSVVEKCRKGCFPDALWDEITWWIILAGGAMAVLGVGSVSGVPVVLCAGCLMLIYGAGRGKKGFGKVTSLVGAVYNGVTGFFSDILSYVRLMALMLSGAVLAQVFNMLGASTGNIVGFIVISLVGNTLNLALNLLGCYVHDMRLQFLEFFGRFYKEGGKAYRPLRLQAKHVEIIKEENES